MAQFIQSLMDQFGYYVLSIALFLELLALPLPGEVIMTYAGLMVYQGHYNWILTILAAGIGASIGMTISYWIGNKLGPHFFEKHGHKFHFGPERFKKTTIWFEKFGVKLVFIAFFIPGVRHITGYFSGITHVSFRKYAFFAYSGAFVWTATFISLGKILGPKWELYHQTISKYFLVIGIILVILVLIYFGLTNYRKKIYTLVFNRMDNLIVTFNSLRKVRLLLLFSFSVFLILFPLMLGLIQDFLGNEFTDFDNITSYLIHAIFDVSWKDWMNQISYIESYYLLFPIALLAFITILLQKKDPLLESSILLFVLLGGTFLNEALSNFFYHVGPSNFLDSFPNEETFMTITFLGFTAYIFIRRIHIKWIQTAIFILVIGASFLVGLSQIYFNKYLPSDLVAGYVFGGVWVSLNIVLLELYRFVKSTTTD